MYLRPAYFLCVLILLSVTLGWPSSPAIAHELGLPSGEHAFVPPPRQAQLASDDSSLFLQPSAFMAGRVAVQAIFVESDGTTEPSTEDWNPAQIATIRSQVAAALDWWEARLPNARLNFDLTTRVVDTSYEPISHDLMDEGLWIADVLDRIGSPGLNYFEQAYDADDALRLAGNTDWATTIFIINSEHDDDGRFADGPFAYAYIGGPFMVMTSDSGPYGITQLAPVVAHELGHIFGALDQYASAQVPCTQESGYLSVPTTNSQLNNCGTHLSSIMLDPVPAFISGQVDPSALGQIGYRDSEQDGIPDPLDTVPTLEASVLQPPSGERPFVSGEAVDQPRPANFEPAATINTIERIEYRVNNGDWIWLPAADGNYDSATESVTATLPLYDGQHDIELRAINSVGAASELVRQRIVVSNVGAEPEYMAALPVLTNSVAITVALATPAGSSVQISEDPFFRSATWIPATQKTWQLNPSDGLHTLYIRFRDGKGLESPPLSRTITLDREAPSGSVVFHNGNTPWIEILAEDKVSGITAVQIDDGSASGAWQPFQVAMPIAHRPNDVRVRLRDAAGNISNPVPIHHLLYLPLIRMP